jgi:2-oxoglutarate dehydrogenase E2 component (dihydrolipoamide succinyltransferase)
MAEVSMVMPKMGESVMEATILQWLKKEGETITEAESIVEVATDKVDSEIPAPYGGKLKKILAQVGQIIAVGKPIAIIETTAELANSLDKGLSSFEPSVPLASASQALEAQKAGPLSTMIEQYLPAHSQTGRFYSPLVRLIAQQEGMYLEELDSIPGTGKDNRVTKQDIMAYLKPSKQSRPHVKTSTYSPKLTLMPGDEVIPMDRVRQMIAERMLASIQTAPHVTSFVEADVTNLVQWRTKHKTAFEQKIGIALTYTPLLIEAIVRAIQDYPMINVAVVDTQIIKRKAINIGLAVALPDGNLIVPVIKQADQLSRIDLAQRIHDLVQQARMNQLKPDDVVDGTYTVSNIGSFKNLMGTPIIMQPQVAIMALGAIVKKPAVMETPEGDQIAIRHKMYLSHTYDHRVVDGALGGSFAQRVADYLENFDINNTFE